MNYADNYPLQGLALLAFEEENQRLAEQDELANPNQPRLRSLLGARESEVFNELFAA